MSGRAAYIEGTGMFSFRDALQNFHERRRGRQVMERQLSFRTWPSCYGANDFYKAGVVITWFSGRRRIARPCSKSWIWIKRRPYVLNRH